MFGERERAAVLDSFDVASLDGDPELDRIVKFAARLCDAPFALVNLVGPEMQTFLAREGLDAKGSPTVPTSFCFHTMKAARHTVVSNATDDARFSANSFVTGDPHIRFYAGYPLISHEGAPLGALCVLAPEPREAGLTDFQREGLSVLAQAAMRRLESNRAGRAATTRETEIARTMREIADLLPAIVWSADGEGNFDYYNSRWMEVTGVAGPGSLDDWRTVIHDDDVEAVLAAWRRSVAACEPFECEYRLRNADGDWRWTLSRAIPQTASDGAVRRWYGALIDVDEGHRRSEGRDLLARELSHRIKNIFAVVASLISLRVNKHPDAREFASELIAAIRALGRAHDFVRPLEGEKGDSLHGLLAELMAPYQDESGERVRIRGGDCEIGPRAAMPLALVFHELATNAAKYGALSAERGAIEIALDCPDGNDTARVHWRERGGPEVAEPGEEGFGSRLIRMAVEGQLSGRLERRFAREGLEVDLALKSSTIRS